LCAKAFCSVWAESARGPDKEALSRPTTKDDAGETSHCHCGPTSTHDSNMPTSIQSLSSSVHATLTPQKGPKCGNTRYRDHLRTSELDRRRTSPLEHQKHGPNTLPTFQNSALATRNEQDHLRTSELVSTFHTPARSVHAIRFKVARGRSSSREVYRRTPWKRRFFASCHFKHVYTHLLTSP
jgi:hypothetical protein